MICAHHIRRGGRAGFTLIELMVVLLLMGLVLAMVGPKFTGTIRYFTARSATSQVVADLALARTQAVREGTTASFRLVSPSNYMVTVDAPNGNLSRVVKNVTLEGTARGVAASAPGGARIAFDSRGMRRTGAGLGSNVVITRGEGMSDTVTVTIVGRVIRGN
ncbi:MAG: GspH/FimT family pseudopilin [Gemmatimonadetes bacterium]|nr:GspH/FimT family pseudopilin [Gemmatimonadota bacterium]